MPNLPIRKLGQFGVISDVNPYDLPINAVSKANNVRFVDGKIVRANVFRSILNTTASTPVFTAAIKSANDFDKIIVADRNGFVYTVQNGAETDVTETTWSSTNSDDPYTYTYLQGIAYINRPDHVPWYLSASASDFAKLTNWNSGWRCASLRAFKDYLIALNVTKSSTNYPTMFKWSDIAQYGSVPGSWDETDATKSAGENIIGDMKSPIIDGAILRDLFVIYSSDQIWLVEETGQSDVFRSRRAFDGLGIMSQNCVVEVEGKHFVFGKNDIYVHDGSSFESLVDGTNRKYIFDNLNYNKFASCFVMHNPLQSEVLFAYVSGDADAGFTSTTYANRGAIYNYSSKTWTFVDLPNVGAMTIADISVTKTYSGVSGTWDGFGGTWYNQEAAGRKVIFAVAPASSGDGITASRLYGYESSSAGILPFSVTTEANKKSLIERIGIDLDETGEELRAYKVMTSIYPQMHVQNGDQSVNFKFAGVTFPDVTASFGTAKTFNPTLGYKVDTREGGRYIAWQMTSDDFYDFELSGFDASVVSTGRR